LEIEMEMEMEMTIYFFERLKMMIHKSIFIDKNKKNKMIE